MESESDLTSARKYILIIVIMVSAALPSSLWAQGSEDASISPAGKTSAATSNPASDESPSECLFRSFF